MSDRLERVTQGVFVFGPGSLFPALHRLAEQGWIDGQWSELENGRRVKVYPLAPSGQSQLAEEKKNWRRVCAAMNQVFGREHCDGGAIALGPQRDHVLKMVAGPLGLAVRWR
jgi:PadR family transcriptional regulator, regulatory protein PadR